MKAASWKDGFRHLTDTAAPAKCERLLRHQADAVYTGAFGDVDHFGDLMVLERLVPTDEDNSGTSVLEERGEAGL
jgi:hypothetical protein